MDEKQINKHGSALQHLISSGLEIHSIGEYAIGADQIDSTIGTNMVKDSTRSAKL